LNEEKHLPSLPTDEAPLPLMAEPLQSGDGEQSLQNDAVLLATNLVPVNLLILQSNPCLKYDWILTFLRDFQVGPWILIFAIWTPIEPQTLLFLQLSP
jgi:hypothetical protein